MYTRARPKRNRDVEDDLADGLEFLGYKIKRRRRRCYYRTTDPASGTTTAVAVKSPTTSVSRASRRPLPLFGWSCRTQIVIYGRPKRRLAVRGSTADKWAAKRKIIKTGKPFDTTTGVELRRSEMMLMMRGGGLV